MQLLEITKAPGWAAKVAPGVLERVLNSAQSGSMRSPLNLESRVVAGRARNEDAAVVQIPVGKTIVQTVDILAPIVNDAYTFGRIAAANALSDVYAVGGTPWCAMNMVFFPTLCHGEMGEVVLREILRGGLDTLNDANAVLVGGHTVEDSDIKYGLSITGIIDPNNIATNDGLEIDDQLILTKPIGVGVLSTGVKAKWEHWEESEALIAKWCTQLNKDASSLIGKLGLKATTDVTGFGLGGHALEMALASKVCIEIDSASLPIVEHAIEYANDGLIPGASHANHKHWLPLSKIEKNVNITMESLVFDAQTSGGLLLAVPKNKVSTALSMLTDLGQQGWHIGQVRKLDLKGEQNNDIHLHVL